MTQVPTSWQAPLRNYLQSPAYTQLMNQVDQLYQTATVYPPRQQLYRAFQLTPYDQVRVVIMGQDPYHGPNQANGLAFSINPPQALPPSLRNIIQEVTSDTGACQVLSGDLTPWAQQGVLLLNRVLTVEAGRAGSHRKLGWETFTDQVIATLNRRPDPIIYLLWGKDAQSLQPQIASHHLILQAPHPSPLSAYRGFFGCRHFSTTNSYLTKMGKQAISW